MVLNSCCCARIHFFIQNDNKAINYMDNYVPNIYSNYMNITIDITLLRTKGTRQLRFCCLLTAIKN